MPMKASTSMTAPAMASKAGRQKSNRRPVDASVIRVGPLAADRFRRLWLSDAALATASAQPMR